MKIGVGLWGHKGGSAPPGPIPGPLDFGSGDLQQTSYTTQFDVAAPHVTLGMFFYYTGNPQFTVTHEGEPLEGRVQLSGGHGCLIFIGDNLTVETGALVISCTGGTFGPFYGRVNEMPFKPDMNSLDWIQETFTANSKTFTHAGPVGGRTYGIVACSWWNSPPTARPLGVKVACRDFAGAGKNDWVPSANNATWTWDLDTKAATHTGTATTVTNNTQFDTNTVGVIRYRADLTNYTDIPTVHSFQVRSADGMIGANMPAQRYGDTLTGMWAGDGTQYKSFQLRINNDVTVENVRFYDNSHLSGGICGIIASENNVNSWTYSSVNNMTSPMLSLKVLPAATPAPQWNPNLGLPGALAVISASYGVYEEDGKVYRVDAYEGSGLYQGFADNRPVIETNGPVKSIVFGGGTHLYGTAYWGFPDREAHVATKVPPLSATYQAVYGYTTLNFGFIDGHIVANVGTGTVTSPTTYPVGQNLVVGITTSATTVTLYVNGSPIASGPLVGSAGTGGASAGCYSDYGDAAATFTGPIYAIADTREPIEPSLRAKVIEWLAYQYLRNT